MFKRVQVCLCDLCQKPIETTITRVLLTELNQNELPVANGSYDGRPIDVCRSCMRKIKLFVQDQLIPNQEYDPDSDAEEESSDNAHNSYTFNSYELSKQHLSDET